MSTPVRARQTLPGNLALFVGIALVAVLTLSHLAFISRIDNGVVVRDYWRFLGIIDAFAQHTLTFEALIASTNGPFKSVFVPLLIVGDAVLFDLDLLSLHRGAVLMMAAAATLSVWSLSRETRAAGWWVSLPVSGVGVVLVSPMLYHLIVYGQATTSMYRIALYIGAFWGVGESLRSGARPNGLRAGSLALAVATCILLIGGPFLPAFAASVSLTTAAAAAGRWKRRESLRMPALILVTMAVSLAVYWASMMPGGGPGWYVRPGLAHLRAEPMTGMLFYARLMATSLLGSVASRLSVSVQAAVGGAGVVIASIGIAMAARAAVRGRSGTPLCLLLFSTTCMVLMTIARVTFGAKHAFAPRYLADTPLWQAGMLWLVLAAIGATTRSGNRVSRRMTVATVSMASVVLCAHLATARGQWRMSPQFARLAEQTKAAILTSAELSDDVLAKRLRTNAALFRFVRRGIGILRRHRLNVFRDPEALVETRGATYRGVATADRRAERTCSRSILPAGRTARQPARVTPAHP